jgi:predicted transcriptional regulator
MNNLEKLEKIGLELYGPNWVTPMSHLLGIANSTIRRWLKGKSRVSTTIANDIPDALTRKFNDVLAMANADKMCGDDVTIEMIVEIADKYKFSDEQRREEAIKAMKNAVYDTTYLSNLESIAKQWAAI